MKNKNDQNTHREPEEDAAAHEATIPVQIDSIKRMEGFERSRCVYYRVEGFNDLLPWAGFITESETAVFTGWAGWAALSGPLTPSGESGMFTSSEEIDRTLSDIEDNEELSLNLGHIWVPNRLLEMKGGKDNVNTGDVYRLTNELFLQCYRFTSEMIPEQEWLEYCDSFSDDISASPGETAAFRQWRRDQVKKASDRYYSKGYKQLPKKEDK